MVNGLTINGHYYDPKKQFDIREVYLVLAHMIKYRGNFLMEGDVQGSVVDPTYLKQCFDNIDAILISLNNGEDDENEDNQIDSSECCFNIDEKKASKLANEIFQKINKVSYLEDEEGKLFGKFNSKDIRKKILKLINGGSGVKLKDFLPKEILVAHNGDDEYGDKK